MPNNTYSFAIAAVQYAIQVVKFCHQGRVHAAGLGKVATHGDGVQVGQQDGGGAWGTREEIH